MIYFASEIINIRQCLVLVQLCGKEDEKREHAKKVTEGRETRIIKAAKRKKERIVDGKKNDSGKNLLIKILRFLN